MELELIASKLPQGRWIAREMFYANLDAILDTDSVHRSLKDDLHHLELNAGRGVRDKALAPARTAALCQAGLVESDDLDGTYRVRKAGKS